MERGLGSLPLRCAARTHALIVNGDELRIRCTDPHCPEFLAAKRRGERFYHCWHLPEWTGRGGIVELGCEAGTLAEIVDGDVFRMRCTDRGCPAVVEARTRGEWAYHCWYLPNLRIAWNDFEAGRPAQ